jgi:hypothetical protein
VKMHIGFTWLRTQSKAVSKHGSERAGSIKGGQFLG